MIKSKPRVRMRRNKMKRQNKKESNGKRTSKMIENKVKTDRIVELN